MYRIVTDDCGFSSRELSEYLRTTPDSAIYPRLCRASISYDGEELGEISPEELSDGIESGRFMPGRLKSACVAPREVEEIIRESLEGCSGPIWVISTSSFVSGGTANCMNMVANELREETGRDIRYLDSRTTSHGEVLFLKLVDARFGEIVPTDEEFEAISRRVFHRFTEPDLSFAIASGRYSGLTKAALEGVVGYWKRRKRMPYMYLPFDDKLKIDFFSIHTERKMMEIWRREYVETHEPGEERAIIEFAGRHEEEMAWRLAEILRAEGAEVEVSWLSPPIMVHTGPVLAWHSYCHYDRGSR